jgi:transcriptional regulator with XRE-family HTH domain
MRGAPPSVFAARLIAARHAAGLTQFELAEMVNRNPTHIVNLEGGRGWPSVALLIDLADALRVSVDYLLGRKRRVPRAA